ncbi:MAG TPA: hypothetical protein VII05_05025 [Gaiellaceae bacterium]
MPRSVFSVWVGGQPTALALASMRSFAALGHPYTLYAYEPLEGLPPGVTLADAGQILPRRAVSYLLERRAFALVSDLFRYARLRTGGLWVDTDVIALRAFDFSEDELICGWQDDVLINVAVLGAPAGHPVITAIHRRSTTLRASREWITSDWSRRRRFQHALGVVRHGRAFSLTEAPWGTFGPDLLTKIASELGVTTETRAREVFYPIRFQDIDLLLESGQEADRAITSATYSIHLWNEVLRRRKIVEPPPGSLLERLLEGSHAHVSAR